MAENHPQPPYSAHLLGFKRPHAWPELPLLQLKLFATCLFPCSRHFRNTSLIHRHHVDRHHHATHLHLQHSLGGPRVDCKLLNFSSTDRIFMLASAGCNVLDYLLESPAQIVACDKNPFQLHLLHLKLAMLRDPLLTYAEWWAIWGDSDPMTAELVWRRARHLAPDPTRTYWDSRVKSVFEAPFSASGSCGWAVKYGVPVVLRMFGTSMSELRRMASAPHDVFANWLTNSGMLYRFCKALAYAVQTSGFCSLLGVPTEQITECPFSTEPSFWYNILKQILVDDPNFATDNYFYHFYIFGKIFQRMLPTNS